MDKRELIIALYIDLMNYLLVQSKDENKIYYNDELNDIPFIIGAILDKQLRENNNIWIEKDNKWVDDILITKTKVNNDNFEFWGVVIWGRNKTTEQWTDPGYFKIFFDSNRISKISILFKDVKNDSISYTKFTKNRDVWSGDYYSDRQYNIEEIDWENRMEIICN